MKPTYYIHQPSKELASYVQCYWVTETSGADTEQTDEQICFPLGMVDWIIQTDGDNHFCAFDLEGNEFPKNYIVGIMSEPVKWKMRGSARLIGIRFKPEGMLKLFKIPLKELVNQSVPTEYLMKKEAEFLREKLLSCEGDVSKMIIIIEEYLLNRISKTVEQNAYFVQTLNKIRSKNLTFQKREIVDNFYLCDRQVQRLFKENLGVTPKTYEKIVRFSQVLGTLKYDNDFGSWAGLAQQVGYSDQAHMIRDFKRFCGTTPTTINKEFIFC